MYEEDEYSAAANFFKNITTSEDVLSLGTLLNKICRAPSCAKRYLERHCRDVRELEEFFKENDHLFFMENRRVALSDEQLERDSLYAVQYFEEKLKDCKCPTDYMKLKIKHLEHASSRVSYFITRFYPGKEFKKFFKRRQDIFTLYKDGTVCLVEEESIKYFHGRLKQAQQAQHFMKFRGNVGQAPPHVQTYINRYFHGDEFQNFLIRNSGTFRLDENGFVSLVSCQ